MCQVHRSIRGAAPSLESWPRAGRNACRRGSVCHIHTHTHTHKAPLAKLFALILGLLLPSPASSRPIGGDRPTSSGMNPQCWQGGAGKEPTFRAQHLLCAWVPSLNYKKSHGTRETKKGGRASGETREKQPQKLRFPASPWGLA